MIFQNIFSIIHEFLSWRKLILTPNILFFLIFYKFLFYFFFPFQINWSQASIINALGAQCTPGVTALRPSCKQTLWENPAWWKEITLLQPKRVGDQSLFCPIIINIWLTHIRWIYIKSLRDMCGIHLSRKQSILPHRRQKQELFL